MFSPAARKPHFASPAASRRDLRPPDSPSTPLQGEPSSPFLAAGPHRPATGTPAPWSSRLSILARIQSKENTENGGDNGQIQPVYVGEFPQVVRSAQASLLQKGFDGMVITGGMDRGTCFSWMTCGNQLFIWSHLSGVISKKCVVLEIPSFFEIPSSVSADSHGKLLHAKNWTLHVIRWDCSSRDGQVVLEQCNSAGVILCNRKTQAVVYWPDIYSDNLNSPIVNLPHSESEENGSSEHDILNFFIATRLPGISKECIAVSCMSNGVLTLFRVTPSGIHCEKVLRDVVSNEGYVRSLVWNPQFSLSGESARQFFLLTDHEIQCWTINPAPNANFSKIWTHEIVGSNGDLGIKKDLAGQKHIWLLDLQVDVSGKEFIILVATFCKDRVSSSSYIQYSLLTMKYKQGFPTASGGTMNEQVLERKVPLQVIIPKARMEQEAYLFSMRLRVGGKPTGSAVILSGDGVATVAFYWRGSTRLYQFDLPWDAGKVLDASVFPSSEDNEEGAWVVLTEKAGVWAIPEKAVLLGGVEPPERSLSRKGSTNEHVEEEKRNVTFGGKAVPRRSTSEAWGVNDKQKAAVGGVTQRSLPDEEIEVLLSRYFHDFLLSGEVEGILEKLREKKAFEKERETNVFARVSKSIVDTLAKHWTTTRGAEIVASAVVSSLLLDKQQKHQKYLQFLALSKCHEELASLQRYSLLIIMEHGEKLSSMIQLRELQNMVSQKREHPSDSPTSYPHAQTSSSLWNLIQLVGERARRNVVLLMDRDNSEVFYTKVSDIEELFYCLSHHLEYIVDRGQPLTIQMQQIFEISNACLTVIQAAMHYRYELKNWYPSLEGLTPWNCQAVVKSGLWNVASFITNLLKEAQATDPSMCKEMWSQLEGLTDVLLDASVVSITAKSENGEGHQGLVEEYCRRRDELLHSLHELAKRIVDLKYQESYKGVDDLERKEGIYREVTKPLLLIAKRHEGYQTLWDLCYDLSDAGLLRSLMHESTGPNGGFSYFVFKQLVQRCQYSRLLRLGEEFHNELTTFLKHHKDLLWLHEIFLKQFSSASDTLHISALSADVLSTIEGKPKMNNQLLSLADRRRLLNLSKIAALAGKGTNCQISIRRIEADLQMLKLQEEIVGHLPNAEERQGPDEPLSPGELIDMCLNRGGEELSLKAFEVFAWASASFQRSHKSLLEECWRKAANQDDWIRLVHASTTEGWSDEVSLNYLRETVIFKASRLCYGLEAESCGRGLEDLLPLQKGDEQFSILKDRSSSVEGILMQHRDFPDAGKLMMTAILMGKVGGHDMADGNMQMDGMPQFPV